MVEDIRAGVLLGIRRVRHAGRDPLGVERIASLAGELIDVEGRQRGAVDAMLEQWPPQLFPSLQHRSALFAHASFEAEHPLQHAGRPGTGDFHRVLRHQQSVSFGRGVEGRVDGEHDAPVSAATAQFDAQ